VLRDDPRSLTRDLVALCVLALMSAATEGFAINVRVRRGAHSVSLGEIPLVLGLLMASPLTVLIGRMAGGAADLVLPRRQRGLKLAFNIAFLGIQATTASVVFSLLAGSWQSPGPSQWLAAFAATIATEAVAGLILTATIALHDDPGEWRRLPVALVEGIPLVFVTTSIALACAMVVQHDPRAVVLLAIVTFVTFLGYRGYVRQTQGHEQVGACTRSPARWTVHSTAGRSRAPYLARCATNYGPRWPSCWCPTPTTAAGRAPACPARVRSRPVPSPPRSGRLGGRRPPRASPC
jgi:hypothetical protein